jgi:lipopolysaccharide transport system permease protein
MAPKGHMKSMAVNSQHRITVYSPKTRLNDSLFFILKHFVQEIKRTRWQIWITFKRDFVSAYKQTVAGVLWSILLPLIPITTYLLLAYLRVLKTTENMPFIVYIVIGMTLWAFLSGSLTSPLVAIQKGKVILEMSKYPVLAVIISNFGHIVYEVLVRIVFVISVLVYYRISLAWYIFLLPVLILPLAMFSLGLGMILAILNIITKDVRNIVDVIMRYAIFLSSVIFPMPTEGLIGTLNRFNPFNTFVNTIRDFIVFGQVSHLELYLMTSGVAIIIFLLACKILYAMEYKIKGYL